MDTVKWLELIKHKLINWAIAFVKLLPNLALAVLVFIIFFFAARFMRRIFKKIFLKISEKPTISDLFSTFIYLIILLAGIFISLELMHLDKAVTTLLAGAGIIGLALGFAFQDLTANFISGIFIIFRKPFDAGHLVETNGFTGTVELIQLRSTIIRTTSGLQVTIPNKDIFQKPITNYTLSEQRRIDLAFTVAATADADSIEKKIRDSLSGLEYIDNEKTQVYKTDFTGDKIKFEVWCWVDNKVPENFLKARDTVIQRVQKVLAPPA